MALAEELHQLDDLRTRGVLSDDEFQRAKQRLLDGPPVPPAGQAPAVSVINSFRRSVTDKWIGGVCGGIGRVTGLDAWIWRLIFTLGLMFAGSGLLLYILLWIFVPEET